MNILFSHDLSKGVSKAILEHAGPQVEAECALLGMCLHYLISMFILYLCKYLFQVFHGKSILKQ